MLKKFLLNNNQHAYYGWEINRDNTASVGANRRIRTVYGRHRDGHYHGHRGCFRLKIRFGKLKIGSQVAWRHKPVMVSWI